MLLYIGFAVVFYLLYPQANFASDTLFRLKIRPSGKHFSLAIHTLWIIGGGSFLGAGAGGGGGGGGGGEGGSAGGSFFFTWGKSCKRFFHTSIYRNI